MTQHSAFEHNLLLIKIAQLEISFDEIDALLMHLESKLESLVASEQT